MILVGRCWCTSRERLDTLVLWTVEMLGKPDVHSERRAHVWQSGIRLEVMSVFGARVCDTDDTPRRSVGTCPYAFEFGVQAPLLPADQMRRRGPEGHRARLEPDACESFVSLCDSADTTAPGDAWRGQLVRDASVEAKKGQSGAFHGSRAFRVAPAGWERSPATFRLEQLMAHLSADSLREVGNRLIAVPDFLSHPSKCEFGVV